MDNVRYYLKLFNTVKYHLPSWLPILVCLSFSLWRGRGDCCQVLQQHVPDSYDSLAWIPYASETHEWSAGSPTILLQLVGCTRCKERLTLLRILDTVYCESWDMAWTTAILEIWHSTPSLPTEMYTYRPKVLVLHVHIRLICESNVSEHNKDILQKISFLKPPETFLLNNRNKHE